MNKQLFAFLWVFTLFFTSLYAQDNPSPHKIGATTISGFIKEKGSLETLPGATIYIPVLKRGTTTNSYGFYTLTIPAGDYTVEFSFVGFTKSVQKLSLYKSKKLDIELEASNALQEVVIVGNKESQKITETTQMSAVSVPIGQLQSIPTLLGEKDVFRVLQLLPGVQKGSELSSGFYVRGGSPDQNLIILDDAVVYNANHLFGFFSVFNGDALKSVELFKGGFPARFGERLSSVTVLNMKDGNKEQLRGEAGIGLISSRLTLEGPIKKGKSSFLVSGRRTYIDALMRPLMSADKGVGGYYFYDLNAKYNAYINENNRFYLSGYFGRDKLYAFSENDGSKMDASFGWGNATLTARWNHIFGKNVFSNTSLIYSSYDSGFDFALGSPNGSFKTGAYSSIRDIGGKFDLDYSLASNHFIRTGVRVVSHQFKPSGSYYDLRSSSGNPTTNAVEEKYNSLESNLFVEDDWKINNQFQVNMGLRVSSFLSGDKNYWNIEPRLSAKYMLGNDVALKASYARMNQYIHLLSSAGVSLPTDVWVPSTGRVRPMQSDQIALGVAKDLPEYNLTLSLEGYYKEMNDVLSFKDGASFVGHSSSDKISNNENHSWESDVTTGQGKSYGAELFIQRKVGKFSGWLGYTLSWTKYQFEELNFGKAFYPKQDCRHDISLVGIYQPSPKIKFSAIWVYSTGFPVDIGRAEYTIQTHSPVEGTGAKKVIDYGEKGSFRANASHRLDIGTQFIKKKNRGERIWDLSIYNVYSNRNPLMHYQEVDQTTGNATLQQGSLFQIIPSITYTRKF